MAKGIGNDIIEIERIRESIKQHGSHFYEKLFTEDELNYCLGFQDPAIPIAGRFSAKEAIAKALGTGFGKQLSFKDISISNDELGKPYPQFSKQFVSLFGHPKILISISHCKAYATAVALWVE